MKIHILFKILILTLISTTSNAQFGFERYDSIPVNIGIDTLKMPWAGGLNYAQFSDFDFDFDGDLDLFVFDRSNNQIRVFLTESVNGNLEYVAAQDVRSSFPDDVRYRATMVDYDNDGRKDLWTYGIGGVKVYRNVGDATNGIQWELFKSLLYSDYDGSFANLYVSSSDIPAYEDIDLDGDIDVLTFHIGGERMEYHKNMSMENYGHADSLEFVLKNECWGKFTENANNDSIQLSSQNSYCNGGSGLGDIQKSGLHTGSTILALDYDNSGVFDLILGDVSYDDLSYLTNSGTLPNQDSPMISVDYNFPSNTTPVSMFLFPAAFFIDVDHDNVKDLIVGANAKGVSQNRKSVLYYKNIGTNALPNFIYQQDDFLQEEMIEVGVGSIPILFDYNGDDLEDLLVANFFRYKDTLAKESNITYYQNTGTTTEPNFTFVDDDWLNLSQSGLGLRMVPTFGDLDNDGDKDMIIGSEDGHIHFYPNNATGAQANFGPGQFNLTDNVGADITTFGYASPQLYDLNEDGLLDLIIGKRTGEIMYYQNVGTATAFSFQLITSNLGNVDVNTTSPEGYATPHFTSVDDTTYLFVGNINGHLYYYENIEDSIADGQSFTLINSSYAGINTGGYAAPYIVDIDNDGKLNLFLGGDLGGVWSYETNPLSTVSIFEEDKIDKFEFNLFPNPNSGEFTIKMKEFKNNLAYNILDFSGRTIQSSPIYGNTTTVSLSNIAAGIYFCQLKSKSGEIIAVKKVVISD